MLTNTMTKQIFTGIVKELGTVENYALAVESLFVILPDEDLI